MFNAELFATTFGRCIEVVGQRQSTKDQKKDALRALVALASLGAGSFRLYDGVLSIDDISLAPEVPGVRVLRDRMDLHGIAEIMIGRNAEPKELLALARALSLAPGEAEVKLALREVQSKRVMVIMADYGQRRRPATVSQALEAVLDEPAEEASFDWQKMERSGEAPSMTVIDLGFSSADQALGPDGLPRPAAPAATTGDQSDQSDRSDRSDTGVHDVVPAVPPSALAAALRQLEANPHAGDVLGKVSKVVTEAEAAIQSESIASGLAALARVIELEPTAPEGTPRNSYGIALRRLLTREFVTQLAASVLDKQLAGLAAQVLQRARGEGAEVLIGLLATAESMAERRAYMKVLRGTPQGLDQVVHLLDHTQWFVVRNVAELMGDAQVEEAVPALIKTLSHQDVRVQRAAAVALAKIGSANTVEPLRRLLREGSPELRAVVAGSIGKSSKALAMPLVALAEDETSPEVLREYHRALGRIATGEAVQALARAAEPGGRLIGRKPVAVRLSAVDGLRIAGATSALELLVADGDKSVKDAATAALKEVKRRVQ